jgi:hypothetical protein
MGYHPTNLEDGNYNFNKTQTWHVVELFNFHELLEKKKHKEMLLKFSSFKNLLRMQLQATKPFNVHHKFFISRSKMTI